MAEAPDNTDAKLPAEEAAEAAAAAPAIHVSPSPHVYDTRLTTRRMMIDVLIGLAPVVVVSLIVFRGYAALHVALCVGTCLAAELGFTALRRRPITLGDCSAAVTGLILALSLPALAPWYVSVIGSLAAVGIGKILFGGLGQNIFNPAMVGRAFVMLCFAGMMGASGYVVPDEVIDKATKRVLKDSPHLSPEQARKEAIRRVAWADAVTEPTPMTAAKELAKRRQAEAGGKARPAATKPRPAEEAKLFELRRLFLGNTNGSLGETSALACLIGGLFLLIRRTASWQIPAGVLLAVIVIAGLGQILDPGAPLTTLHHLLGGALLFGAFFIATDLVTSPLTPKGKFIFGLGVGVLVMLIRKLSNYPEGVMFAVLVMNAVVPLINRWTVPRPVGGLVPQRK